MKGQYELAAQDFDAVIERYSSNEQVTVRGYAYYDKAGGAQDAGPEDGS